MLKVGDLVTFKLDGARGLVLNVQDDKCHVVWEDTFVSWEKNDLLILEKAYQPKEPTRQIKENIQ